MTCFLCAELSFNCTVYALTRIVVNPLLCVHLVAAATTDFVHIDLNFVHTQIKKYLNFLRLGVVIMKLQLQVSVACIYIYIYIYLLFIHSFISIQP